MLGKNVHDVISHSQSDGASFREKNGAMAMKKRVAGTLKKRQPPSQLIHAMKRIGVIWIVNAS